MVHWIHASLGGDDELEHDVELADVDTGEPRQIDLLVTVRHGPVEARIIGEVRDRGRPAGSPWIEEVASKMKSVGAHAAFVVSKSGFTRPAAIKARILGIQAFTLAEMDRSVWAERFTLREIVVRRFELQVKIDFLDGAGALLVPHPEVVPNLARLLAPPLHFPAGPQGSDDLSCAMREAMTACVERCGEQLRDLEDAYLQEVTVRFEVPVPFSTGEGRRSLQAVRFAFLFVPRLEAVPFVLSRYIDEAREQGVADVYESRVQFYGQPYVVRLLAETDDGIVRKGGHLSVIVDPKTDLARRIFKGAELASSAPDDGLVQDTPVAVSLALRFRFHEDVLAAEGLIDVNQ